MGHWYLPWQQVVGGWGRPYLHFHFPSRLGLKFSGRSSEEYIVEGPLFPSELNCKLSLIMEVFFCQTISIESLSIKTLFPWFSVQSECGYVLFERFNSGGEDVLSPLQISGSAKEARKWLNKGIRWDFGWGFVLIMSSTGGGFLYSFSQVSLVGVG